MAIAGSCVSTMEKCYLWITTSPESTTFMYTQNTRKGHPGRLASSASHHQGGNDLIIRRGQHCCSPWADQSRMSSRPLGPCGSGFGKSIGSDAGAIPGADTPVALLNW